MSPDDLHARMLAECERRKSESLRVAREHRQRAAEAREAGDLDIARTLGMLAAHLEQSAALAEAERRDRIARHAKGKRAEAARAAASAPRPSRADPLRAAILDALRPLKRGGADFKAVLRTWEQHRIGALRLTPIDDAAYEVADEDTWPPVAKRYTWQSLRTLYTESGKPRR